MEERRREDQELAHWRGGIDARLQAVEGTVGALLNTTKDNSLALARAEGKIDDIRSDVGEMRAEIRGTAKRIDQGREDAVTDLKAEFARGKLSREQKMLVAVAAVATPVVSTLITVASTGSFH